MLDTVVPSNTEPHMIGISHYIGQVSASLWASLVNIYDIPIARVMAIGSVLLAIVAIALISFAIQNLLLGISLYRHARSEHVSQELHKKAHDTLVIAAAYFGGAIYVAILIWSIVTGTSYIVLDIGVCICAIVILVKFTRTVASVKAPKSSASEMKRHKTQTKSTHAKARTPNANTFSNTTRHKNH